MPDYVEILPAPLPAKTYTLYEYQPGSNGLVWEHSPFYVKTYPIEGHTLCGEIMHQATYANGQFVDTTTQPLTYDSQINMFTYYTENPNDVGMKEYSVRAYFMQQY